jgi:hypothetical protein
MTMMCVIALESDCAVCPSYDLMSRLTNFY